MLTEIFKVISDSFPAIVVGAIAYFFWMKHFKNEDSRRNYLLLKDNVKVTTPIRLQAYERIILLLERINPKNLIVRLQVDNSENLTKYKNFLIDSINKEFEHNFSQQLYISEDVWERVLDSKILSINMINLVFQTSITSKNPISDFKNKILELTLKRDEDPTRLAIELIKKEAQKLYKF